VRLDPAYKVLFEGEPEALEISGDLATTIERVEAIEPGAGASSAQSSPTPSSARPAGRVK